MKKFKFPIIFTFIEENKSIETQPRCRVLCETVFYNDFSLFYCNCDG